MNKKIILVMQLNLKLTNYLNLGTTASRTMYQVYNADGKAIATNGSAATESLPFEYSLTKRGKKDLTGEDETIRKRYIL